MTPHRPKLPRWRASLTGDGMDLLAIKEHFQLETMDIPQGNNLVSFFDIRDIDEIEDYSEVRSIADALVSEWNTALSLFESSYVAVRAGDYVQRLNDDGTQHSMIICVQPNPSVMRSRISLIIITFDGSPLVSRTPGQRLRSLMQKDINFASALRLFEIGQNDFRLLYIALEYVRDALADDVGNREARWAALKCSGLIDSDQMKRFKNTANDLYRHKPKLIDNPMLLPEARSFIRELLMAWCDRQMPK